MTERKLPDTGTQWNARIGKARRFMRTHAAEPLMVADLARETGTSVFHFVRMFHALTGETPLECLTRVRLGLAVGALLAAGSGRAPVTRIALEAGYQTPSSFNKAFKARLGVTPSALRHMQGRRRATVLRRLADPRRRKPMKLDLASEPQIVQRVPTAYVHVRRLGRFTEEAPRAWEELHRLLWPAKLVEEASQMIGACWDDAEKVEESKLRYDAGVTVHAAPASLPKGLGCTTLPGGRYASFRHRGPYTNLAAAFDRILTGWVAKSGAVLRPGPCLEVYLNTPGETKPEDLLTDLQLPIE